jgi:hypothetical protein
MGLFDGGAIQARIDQARARERQLNAQLKHTTLELSQRLDQLRSQYDEAQEALAILAESIPPPRITSIWHGRVFSVEVRTLLEVLDNYQAEILWLRVFHERLSANHSVAEMPALVGFVHGRQALKVLLVASAAVHRATVCSESESETLIVWWNSLESTISIFYWGS